MHEILKRCTVATARSLGLVAMLAVTSSALAERAVLVPLKDNTLIESATGARSNGSGPHLRAGRTGQQIGSVRRGLIAFDVTRAVPPGATVVDVALILHMSATGGSPARVSLHRVLADWGEGASAGSGGQGAPAAARDATWIHRFYDNVLWNTPGGDFALQPSASADVDDVGIYVWRDPGMVADVQRWLRLPAWNHGWALVGDEQSPQTVKRFDAREIELPEIPPLLLIDFVPRTEEEDDESNDESSD